MKKKLKVLALFDAISPTTIDQDLGAELKTDDWKTEANVLDADLFKAVIAVAPVTDLGLLKHQASVHANSFLVADMIGNGPHVREGSPAENAGIFKAPVLMFHGTSDFNVEIEQSRKMDRVLRRARKPSQLVVYPELSHGLLDGTARADLLRKSEAFLRANLDM